MQKVEIIKTVVEFANKATEVVKVVKAFLVGYEAFIRELNSSDEK